MRIEADTPQGRIEWVDGHLSCSTQVLAELRQADPRKSYGLMPGVSAENALHYADAFIELVREVYPDAKISHDDLDAGEEDDLVF